MVQRKTWLAKRTVMVLLFVWSTETLVFLKLLFTFNFRQGAFFREIQVIICRSFSSSCVFFIHFWWTRDVACENRHNLEQLWRNLNYGKTKIWNKKYLATFLDIEWIKIRVTFFRIFAWLGWLVGWLVSSDFHKLIKLLKCCRYT